MALLHIEVVSRNGSDWLCPKGELDMSTIGVVEHELRWAEGRASGLIVIDLRGLTFMDSTGLHLLIEAAARARAAGRRLVLVKGRTQVMRVFEITGLAERLDFVDDPAAVLTPNARRVG